MIRVQARWLKPEEVRVGDRVIEYRYAGQSRIGTVTGTPEGHDLGRVLKIEAKHPNDYESSCYGRDGTFYVGTNGTEWYTFRDSWAPVPTAKAGVSPWNGKCRNCGKGTYTGFTSVEHEGGSCG